MISEYSSFIENFDDFESVDFDFLRPKSTVKTRKSVFLGWTFENCFNLAIEEIIIYVDSKTNADSIRWIIETNAYHGELVDKNYNTIKLETPQNENFHEFITLKLEMDPSKVDKFLKSASDESQIEMRVKFKSDSNKAARVVKWLPNVKISTENNKSCFDRIFRQKSDCLPKFHFIVAIDETAQFSKGPNGSIQHKLRRAVNNLIKKLLKKMTEPELESCGLVVVRFGGTMHEESVDFNDDDGPFRRQIIRNGPDAGKSIYEFAPFFDAKRSSDYPNGNFADYYWRLLQPDPKLTSSSEESLKVEEATPFLSVNQNNDQDKNATTETKLSEIIEDKSTKVTEDEQSYELDFLQARNIIRRLYDHYGYPEMIDLFVSIFYS